MLIVFLFSLIVFFYFYVCFLLKENIFFVFLLWFGHFWMALSSAYIESGIYISEQERFSFFNGATFYLLFFELFLWWGVLVGVRISHKNNFYPVRINKNQIDFYLFVVFFVLAILFVNVMISGSPLWTDGLSRFNYWESSRMSFLKNLVGEIGAPFIVVLGVSYSIYVRFYRKYRLIPIVLFFTFLIYYWFIGHKFSAQFLACTLFFPPVLYFYYIKNNGIQIRLKYIIRLLLILAILGWSIGYFYINKHADFVSSQGGVLNSILYRIFGLQGHVWWGAVTEAEHNASQDLFLTDFNSVINGLQTMMYVVSPTALVDRYIDNGIRFTMAFPAIIYYSFGAVVTSIFEFIIGLILGVFIAHLKSSLLECRFFSSVLILIVSTNMLIVLNMGDFSVLLSPKNTIPLALICFLYLNGRRKSLAYLR